MPKYTPITNETRDALREAAIQHMSQLAVVTSALIGCGVDPSGLDTSDEMQKYIDAAPPGLRASLTARYGLVVRAIRTGLEPMSLMNGWDSVLIDGVLESVLGK